MAKVKNTKNELKAQRDALKRYQRYLPTLQLKKQQLQMEVRQVEAALDASVHREDALIAASGGWVALFSDVGTAAGEADLRPYLTVERVVTEEANVAGVAIPVLADVVFTRTLPDLFATPAWWDDALDLVAQLARVRLERAVLAEQKRRLAEELRTTNQRVNLFERVKIPECRSAIAKIRIFLGDVQTLDVARGKIAKANALQRGTAS